MYFNIDGFKAWLKERIEAKKEEIRALEQDLHLLTSNDFSSILSQYKQYEEGGMESTPLRDRLGSESSESIERKPISIKEKEKIGGTDAVRNLFSQDPTRRWAPREVRHELETMLSEGLLDTQRSRISPDFVHSILSALVKQNFLDKHQPVPKSRRSWYVKRESLEKDLAGEFGESLEGKRPL